MISWFWKLFVARLSALAGYRVTIDYRRSLKEMSQYAWVLRKITAELFPHEEQGIRSMDLYLVEFDTTMTKKMLTAELEKRHLRGVTMAELLAFGEEFPEKVRTHRKSAIIAVGQVCSDYQGLHIPYLYYSDGEIDLRLREFDHDVLFSDCRFLCADKK